MNPSTADAVLPPDEVMSALLALATGTDLLLNPDTGAMAVRWEDGKGVLIDGEHLDELFLRKWIAADDDKKVVSVTEAGAYWCARWCQKRDRTLRRERRTPR